MMEPYDYPIEGKTVKMTSFMTNLFIQSKFSGILGADFSLEQLQAELHLIGFLEQEQLL